MPNSVHEGLSSSQDGINRLFRDSLQPGSVLMDISIAKLDILWLMGMRRCVGEGGEGGKGPCIQDMFYRYSFLFF